jgi:uncharacterized protein (TIGR04222 family)
VGNPLDLRGPDFLVFYAVVALIVLLLLWVARVSAEGGRTPQLETTDPYLIAYLRGGANEALRVATVALIDRGLLGMDEAADAVVARAKPDAARRPIEQALLRHFEQPHLPKTIFGVSALEAACDQYDARLTQLGLLPGPDQKSARRRLLSVALLVLLGLSVAKIVVALGRGRTNVGFLVVLTLVASVIAAIVVRPRLTARGARVLADLRRLFRRLRDRAETLRPGGATADAALLAAVFGLAALPSAGFAFARQLYPKASSSTGGSCGSSCGSGCGGGGDGGGCGGCGGGGGD